MSQINELDETLIENETFPTKAVPFSNEIGAAYFFFTHIAFANHSFLIQMQNLFSSHRISLCVFRDTYH